MNVQIIRFADVWLKGLCLKICNTVRCNKELVSQDFSTVERRKNFVKKSQATCCKINEEEEEIVERHVERCWCKEVDE